MKTITLFILFSSSLIADCQLKIDYKHFYDLLSLERYDIIFREACDLHEQPYGKTCFVKYLIAKCLCESDYNARGIGIFNDILMKYSLNPRDIDFILSEKIYCISNTIGPQLPPGYETLAFLNSLHNAPRALVEGKLGYADCSVPPEFIKIVDTIDEAEFNSRLFQIDQSTSAISKIKSIIGSQKYSVTTMGRFIFVKKATSQYTINYKKMTETLEKVYQFYYNYYSIRPPDKLITIYIVPSKSDLQELALVLHGLFLPDTYIGYSNISDLSIMGVGDNEDNIGTFKHELFHLMIRTDLGDIPAWLDEGLACLYETSKMENDSLYGEIKNWRTKVLKDFEHQKWTTRNAKITELIEYDWAHFEGSKSEAYCLASYNYALAKHFMVYAQSLNITRKLIENFKNRNDYLFDLTHELLPKSDVQLIEDAFGKNIYQIQADFDDWLDSVYHITLWENPVDMNSGTEFPDSNSLTPLIIDPLSSELLILELQPEITLLEGKLEAYEKMNKPIEKNDLPYNSAKQIVIDYYNMKERNIAVNEEYITYNLMQQETPNAYEYEQMYHDKIKEIELALIQIKNKIVVINQIFH
jgi:hypothetical protein